MNTLSYNSRRTSARFSSSFNHNARTHISSRQPIGLALTWQDAVGETYYQV
ncbi:MAG: hypothetical protein NZM04_02550 [Methylacidiphilales bacterium]|nr:hypothetical protein [Candidatus Methylacidiphilales bacterium]